ncbi:MAG: RIP metalloprotease RseP [Methyloceanibacter sp.]|uniref:RIP metalloprotease RseP n=1 Tax=Methyloceanibacter sp. TaxID=1965321 RepID=UPI001D578476|nr:RIP metalloprotease RseP [Methyloceanibacter sp.]MCB1443369.1 RIP metalloprotease RseP [Methyloceanibacter sp.]MCC0058023.1 RIP metalloprotease RseP [Hyphomicrobiaceae bacterium]
MDIFTSLAGFGGTLLGYLIPFLFVLTVVVFVHEMGHFLVARWCGVGIKAFSIGFGPEIFGFNDRHGTRWRVAWIPLGGYVKFIDDENAASAGQKSLDSMSEADRKISFQGKSLAQRAAIVAAGPIANFIFAILIFTAIFSVFGERITAPKVDSITPGSAAERAGFKPGDLVTSIDGTSITNFSEMQRIVATSPDRELHFVVDRGGAPVDLTAVPERKEITDRFGNTFKIGLLGIKRSASPDDWTLERHDPLTAFVMGVKECYFVVSRSLGYLYDVIKGREDADQLGGPLRIAQVSGQVATAGFLALLNLAAIISVSIGLINLFPIPMLDGGHLLFYGIEAVRGKPLSESTQEIGFRIGLAFVLMLMIFATWNDLIHLKFL